MKNRALRIGARGVYHDALARIAGYSVQVLTSSPMPDFPWDFTAPLALDYGGNGDEMHDCQTERKVVLSAFVVVDCVVSAVGGCRFYSEKRFNPYFVRDVIVLHESMPWPCMGEYRLLHGAEAVCCMAQNPWLGSVRFASKKAFGGTAEAYCQRRSIVVDDAGNRDHHLAFVRRSTTPVFDSHKEIKF